MKTKTNHSFGWKHIYMVLIVLILMAALLLRSSDDSSKSSTMPSSQDQFVESSPSAEDQFTAPSPSAQDTPVVAPDDVSVSMNPEGAFEVKNSDAVTTEETKNEELMADPVTTEETKNEELMSDPVTTEETKNEELMSDPVTTEETKNEELMSDPLPLNASMLSPSTEDNSDMEKNITYSSMSETQVCNYAKGKWAADSRRPLYSGFKCKRWLPSPWACRLTHRADFSYEGYRWGPINCQMPEFERFGFLKKMQDKTIAFIGDSLGRQQFHSLMCMATGGEDAPEVEDVGREFGLIKRSGAANPDGWAYRFPTTNTTILFYWSSTLCRLERINNTDPDSSFALHLDRVPTFLTKFLHRFHVLVLNTAHHWIKTKFIANRWVMHVNRKPVKDGILMDMINVKNYTVHRVVKWLDSQLPFHPGLKAFFRTRSPRHFDRTGNCNNTIPLTGGSEVFQEGSSDEVVETAVKGTRVNILDITALSALRDEAHKSQFRIFGTSPYYDCLHWCLPGIPDTWNELLVAQL